MNYGNTTKIIITSAVVAYLAGIESGSAGELCRSWLDSNPDLSEEPQDSTMAINDPDCYAWRLFVALNWPADKSSCMRDSSKRLGEPGEVVWEVWRSKFQTYLDKAEPPMPWDQACQGTVAAGKALQPTAQFAAVREAEGPTDGIGTFFSPVIGEASTARDEEVRLNRDTYEFIRTNNIYDLNEQEKLAAEGVGTLVFPLGAKEIKAHWLQLEDEADKDRYHWAEYKGKIYGLVALHIITRDLPRWFWATFEHEDNEKRWPDKFFKGRADPGLFRGWVVRSRDSISCDKEPFDCNAVPKGFGLEGTKWSFYRLRGTQTDWVDHRGEPTILVSSKIEAGFDQRSSCISCHALAVKGETGGPMPFALAPFGQMI